MEKEEREKRLSALGKRITQFRKMRNLSMERLAFMAGLSKEAIRRIERAEKDPRYTTLFQIAEALNIRASILIDVPFTGSKRPKSNVRKFNDPEVEL